MARKKYTEVEHKIMKNVADNLKKFLKNKNMSQKELAELTELATSTISDYINAKTLISPGNLQLIADVLNVPKSSIDSSLSQNNHDNLNEFDEDTRALARDIKSLDRNSQDVLKSLIKTMKQRGKEASEE